jgi:hypothetical protein
MNVEIGTEAVQFPEKEYINGIFVAASGGHYLLVLAKRMTSPPPSSVLVGGGDVSVYKYRERGRGGIQN